MERRFKAGVVGATGMVGQRFVRLLEAHPLFAPVKLLASPRSAGKKYGELMAERWAFDCPVPAYAREMTVFDATDPDAGRGLDVVFCAVNLPKEETRALEERYARAGVAVISNNSAHRFTPDVPMVIPEVNPEHLGVIPFQRERLGTETGFIAVKSNCSLQSYVPLLHPLRGFGIREVAICTYQAISGAGKTFATMPEIIDNVLPFIGGEEEKSEQEPRKIWGALSGGKIVPAAGPRITAQCLRVPVSDGHTAAVFVSFEHKPSRAEILSAWETFRGAPQELALPSAPRRFLHYMEEADRPQPKLDRMTEGGMAVVGAARN